MFYCKKAITLLCCFALFSSTFSLTPTPTVNTPQTACTKLKGWYWDSSTNSCQRSIDTRSISTCDDKATSAEKQECVQAEVLNLPELQQEGVKESAGYEPEKWGGFDSIENFTKIPMAALHSTYLVGAIGMWAYQGKCVQSSVQVMGVGALVGLATDLGTWLYLKSQLNSLKTKLQEEVEQNQQQFIDIQAKTFDTLAEAYSKRSQVEMMRAFGYGVSSAAFALATAIALYEAYKGPAAACAPSSSAQTTAPSSSATSVTNVPVKPADSKISSKVVSGSMLGPITRAALSGAMTIISAVLTYKTYQASQTSKERRDFIRQLKASIVETQGAFKCTNRDDSSTPSCYCYTETGERNYQSRSNSEICKNYWASLDSAKNAPTGGKYGIKDADEAKASCVTQGNELDPLCKCKDMKDAVGNNACYKSSGVVKSATLPGTAWAQNLDKQIQGLLNGQSPANTATPQSMTKMAANIKDLGKKTIAESNKEALKNGQPTVSLENKDIEKSLNDLQKEVTPPVEKSLQDQFGTNLSKALTNEGSLSNPLNLASGSNKKDLQFDNAVSKKKESAKSNPFGAQGGGGSEAPKILNDLGSMNSDLKYEGGLNKDSGGNIWQIISHRYQLSGYNRLIKEE